MSASDEELILALQAGDTGSLGVLVSRWERPLFRFVYRQLPRPDEASDVCQETFLRILDKADRYRPGSRFSTWMYQIALNLCRDRLRRRRRWGALVFEREELPEPAPNESGAVDVGPESECGRNELRAAVRHALGDLPAEQREVLIMKEFEGLKFREIAAILDCPESTVKSRMYHGLDGLRAALEQRGIARV